MAMYHVKGAPIARATAAGDLIAGTVVLKGYAFRHTAAGSARVVSGSTGTTTNVVFHAVLTGAGGTSDTFYEPIVLQKGLKVLSMTGTELLLYV